MFGGHVCKGMAESVAGAAAMAALLATVATMIVLATGAEAN